MRFFFIVNLNKPHARERALGAMEALLRAGGVCVVDNGCAAAFAQFPARPVEELGSCDMVVAVGGDGTIMAAGKQAALRNRPILGVNAGRLGFLSGAEGNEPERLVGLLNGKYTERSRMLLSIRAGGEDQVAVNDLVVARPALGSIIDVSVQESNHPVIDYRADSVLFSTPVGSTAYALSNGGPVADPALRFVSMSPICAHSLVSRTYLFAEDAVLSATLTGGGCAYLLADGQQIGQLREGETVQIRKSDKQLRLVYLEDLPFFEIVSRKFL